MKSLHIVVPVADEEIAADRLWQLGVEAIGVGDQVDGVVELWTSVGESPASLQRAVEALDDLLDAPRPRVVEPAETWREHVAPTWYDPRGVVVPAWQQLAVADDVLATAIEPASSFGLGDHPTTATTLALLVEHLRSTAVSTMLDVGCGSGVLGIVAAQHGATVRATDISAAAVEATEGNARRNGVDGLITADTASLDALAGPYDVVVANILAPVLISMADDLGRLVAPTGRLLISGVLADSHEHVLDALAPLRPVETRTSAGWACVMLAR